VIEEEVAIEEEEEREVGGGMTISTFSISIDGKRCALARMLSAPKV
jgi:hypothetical protein